MDATAVLSPGDRLGEYVVERQLRVRDRVTVYWGSEPSVGRSVALYVAHDHAGTQAAEAFLQFGRELAGVEHPALQPIYSVDTDGATAFAAARLAGTPADLLLLERPLSEPAAVAV